MIKRILLVGGGGHCKSVLDSLLQINEYSEMGIIDKQNIGDDILGVPIIGSDDDLSSLYAQGYQYAFVTIGSIGDPSLRIKLFSVLEEIGFQIPNIIDPTAIISENIKVESGIFIGKNVIINAGSYIGKGSIINSGSVIEHDCVVNKFSHIAPGSVLCGEVQIGDNTHIGAKSVIKQKIKIGANTIIGIGSVVTKDIGANSVAYGNPCKEVKSR